MKATIIGSRGFVGRHLVCHLRELGIEPYCPTRNEPLVDRDLGTVFYCAGITADFRSKPLEAVESHVCSPIRLIQGCDITHFVYFSSSRIYSNLSTGIENAVLAIDTSDADQLYNVSKIAGEMSVISSGIDYHIVRPSNIIGDNWKSRDFVYSITKDALEHGLIQLYNSFESAKDYIGIDYVVESTTQLVRDRAPSGVYNISSGTNISHAQIVDLIVRYTKCTVEALPGAQTVIFPIINNHKIVEFIGRSPENPLDTLDRELELHCAKIRAAAQPN